MLPCKYTCKFMHMPIPLRLACNLYLSEGVFMCSEDQALYNKTTVNLKSQLALMDNDYPPLVRLYTVSRSSICALSHHKKTWTFLHNYHYIYLFLMHHGFTFEFHLIIDNKHLSMCGLACLINPTIVFSKETYGRATLQYLLSSTPVLMYLVTKRW